MRQVAFEDEDDFFSGAGSLVSIFDAPQPMIVFNEYVYSKSAEVVTFSADIRLMKKHGNFAV